MRSRVVIAALIVALGLPIATNAAALRLGRKPSRALNAKMQDKVNPLNPVSVRVADDAANLPLRCGSHADCGWSEYCGWHPSEVEQGQPASRCQACVGCVEPAAHRGNSQYFVAFGTPLAPVNGRCPDCDARAKLGMKSQRPAKANVVKSADASVEELRRQKRELESNLTHVKASIWDIRSEQQKKEQALEDEIAALRKELTAKKIAKEVAPPTTTAKPSSAPQARQVPGAPMTYNTYNIYNTYNTQHTYNSNGHTFNSFSSCENVSVATPAPPVPLPQGSLLQTRTTPPVAQSAPGQPGNLGLRVGDGSAQIPQPCV